VWQAECLVEVNGSLVLVNSMRRPTVVVRSDILSSWLTVSDYSKSQLANELGVSRGRISQLLSAHEEPSAHLMAKLLLLTQLPFDRLFIIKGNGGEGVGGVYQLGANQRNKRAGVRTRQRSIGTVGVHV
jgi:transcriptional regulator with XRE-family HTH domain